MQEILTFHEINDFEDLSDRLNQCKLMHLSTVNVTRNTNPHKPWIDEEFLELIDERRRYFDLLKRSSTNEYLKMKYKEICDNASMKRNSLRSNFNSKAINKHGNNPKLMWKNINSILYNKTQEKNRISAIKTDDVNIATNRKTVANTLNMYFKNVGKTLHDLIPNNITPQSNSSGYSNPQSMRLFDTTIEEIILKINNLKKSNCTKDII